MVSSDFDDVTALHARGEGRFSGRLNDQWSIGPAVNGGVLMGVVAGALRATLGHGEKAHRDPLALSAHFLSPGAPGEVSVEATALRRGRNYSTGQAVLSQPDESGEARERLRALATYGDLDASAEMFRAPSPPEFPAPERCVDAAQRRSEAELPTLIRRLDLRLDPATAGWAVGRPSGRGEMRGWIKFADGRDADPVSLLFFLDAMPPTSFDLGIPGWAPTLEFSGHVRGRPAPGWLQIQTRSHTVTQGLLEEDAWIWDSTGRLVAQSRQLAGVRIPASGLPAPS